MDKKEDTTKKDCRSTQLIDDNGLFNVDGLESFMKSVKPAEGSVSYAVVAIMGPQSSGKSTLLNNLFFTNFVEMKADLGRKQTTKGIWIAEAVNVDPFTIVLDLEGNNGRERGENKAFEKQTALFALAVADVVLINIWEKDIGREEGASKPLMTTVFQAMEKLFPPRKTTLLFVIRDKNQITPLEKLEDALKKGLQKIWEGIPKPEDRKDATLSDFFTVQVIGLCNYEFEEEQFKLEVATLRKRFYNSIAPDGLAGDRKGVVPWSALSYSAQQIWKVITEDKDLDLPSHKVMVATVRCEEIAREKLRLFKGNESWLALEAAAKSRPVSDFGEEVSSILLNFLSEYDKEVMYFDEGVRNAKRQQLESSLLQLVHPIYETLLGHLLSQATEKFETQLSTDKAFAASVRDFEESCMLEFNQQCADARVQQATDWDSSYVREKLRGHIEAYSSSLRISKLSEIEARCQKKLSQTIEAPIESLLVAGRGDIWGSIRNLVKQYNDIVELEFRDSVSGLELDESTCEDMLQRLRDYARSFVVIKARQMAPKVLLHMKDRFSDVFILEKDSQPRCWKGNEDIEKFTLDAKSASLQMLSVMAATRWEEGPDNVESILFSSLMDMSTLSPTSDGDPLTSSVWDENYPDSTIITPMKCKSLWMELLTSTNHTITLANSAKATATSLRCKEIANEKLSRLLADERWLALEVAAKSGSISNFGVQISSILETYVSEYDTEAISYDKHNRDAKRQQLLSDLLERVRPTYEILLCHLFSQATQSFEIQLEEALNRGERFTDSVRNCEEWCMLEFGQQCADSVVQQSSDWDATNIRKKLRAEIEAHSSYLYKKKLSDIVAHCEQKLFYTIAGATEDLLKAGNGDSWPSIRDLLKRQTDRVVLEFLDSVSGFELEKLTNDGMLQGLKDYARSQVVQKARGLATVALKCMKDRFIGAFILDGGTPSCWNGNEDIAKMTSDAQTASLKMLSVMAVIRLDEGFDNIDKQINALCLTDQSSVRSLGDGVENDLGYPLISSVWDKVSSDNTIITPEQCKFLWTEFKAVAENIITQAISFKVTAATNRCDENVNKKVRHFRADERWLALKAEADSGPVSDFGKQISSILATYLSEYDKESMYFDELIRDPKRKQLESKLLELVYPTYQTLLGHLFSQATQRFKTQVKKAICIGEELKASAVRNCQESCMLEFDKQCEDVIVQQSVDWNASVVREKLTCDIEAYSSSLCSEELSDIVASCQAKLLDTIGSPTENLLIAGDGASWPAIRNLLRTQTDAVASDFLDFVSKFELEESACDDMLESLKDYAKSVLVSKARDTASEVGKHIMERFSDTFSRDENSMKRRWKGNEDIREITLGARKRCLKMLSVMAAVRLDESYDDIERSLNLSCLTPGFSSGDADILTTNFWNGVPPKDTILTPVECKIIWNELLSTTEEAIDDAIKSQEANNLPPAPVRAEPNLSISLLLKAIKTFGLI